jgi:hypothetical protein
MSENQLPAVASNFYAECKKCEVERYHKVMTHPTPTSAKLKCEVCGKTSTYKLNSKKEKTAKTPKLAGAAKIAKEKSLGKKAQAYKDEFDSVVKDPNSESAIIYNMKVSFKEKQTLRHPKFGVGYVKSAHIDKIEVLFVDEARFLVHNRT